MDSRKKLFGIVLLAIGFAILVFSYIYFMTRPEKWLSPVPYDRPPKAIPSK